MTFFFRIKPFFCVALLVGMGSPLLRALDEPVSFTIDLPFQVNQATPAWLGHPETPATSFATLNLPIVPPDANASLLVTVYFQEKDGGFLRIGWQAGQGTEQILSNNFYEGIGMANQRSLLITAQTLQGSGTLSFQCGDTTLGIQRIKLEWVENRTSLVSPRMQDLLVTSGSGQTQPSQQLNGEPPLADDPVWHRQIVDIPVTSLPQRIEEGVEFSVQLDTVPTAVRLVFKEDGLPLGSNLVAWINQQRAGTVSPRVPDLNDEGFTKDASGQDTYVGWRDGSLYIPVALLKQGINTVQLSDEDNMTAAPSDSVASPAPMLPLAVKDMVLQLNFPPSQPTVAQAQAQPTPPIGGAVPATDTSTLPELPAPGTMTSPSASSTLNQSPNP